MPYYITRHAPEETPVLNQQAWQARFVITSDESLLPAKCLVFHAEDPEDANSRAWFECVANPSQLEEYPEDYPGNGTSLIQPYYLTDEVTAVGRTAEELQEFHDELIAELTGLQNNIRILANMAAQETTAIPDV